MNTSTKPKERGVVFKEHDVLGFLHRGKTQARFVINPQPQSDYAMQYADHDTAEWEPPLGDKGDVIWVKESWVGSERTMRGYFRADLQYWDFKKNEPRPEPGMPDACKWKPSTTMPRWACRITLEIVSVRVERIQSISGKNIIAEGAVSCPYLDANFGRMPVSAFDKKAYWDLKSLWASGWEQKNGKGAWSKNDWVWVYDLKRLTPTTVVGKQ